MARSIAPPGPELLEECRTLGGCPTGQAKITKGYRLPAKFVIHAVGPRYRDGRHGEPELLASCYAESLKLAVAHGVRSIAFPAISCGIYGYPIPDAARIAVRTVAEFLAGDASIERVILACFGKDVLEAYQAALRDAAAVAAHPHAATALSARWRATSSAARSAQ